MEIVFYAAIFLMIVTPGFAYYKFVENDHQINKLNKDREQLKENLREFRSDVPDNLGYIFRMQDCNATMFNLLIEKPLVFKFITPTNGFREALSTLDNMENEGLDFLIQELIYQGNNKMELVKINTGSLTLRSVRGLELELNSSELNLLNSETGIIRMQKANVAETQAFNEAVIESVKKLRA